MPRLFSAILWNTSTRRMGSTSAYGIISEHGLGPLVVLTEPAEALGVTFHQLAELFRPRVEEHFAIRPERDVEIDQRRSAEATGLKHVDVVVAVYLDEAERVPRRPHLRSAPSASREMFRWGTFAALEHRNFNAPPVAALAMPSRAAVTAPP